MVLASLSTLTQPRFAADRASHVPGAGEGELAAYAALGPFAKFEISKVEAAAVPLELWSASLSANASRRSSVRGDPEKRGRGRGHAGVTSALRWRRTLRASGASFRHCPKPGENPRAWRGCAALGEAAACHQEAATTGGYVMGAPAGVASIPRVTRSKSTSSYTSLGFTCDELP